MNRYIGDKIRKAREQLNLSQKVLAQAIGLSDKAISTYESGRTLPPLEILFKISEVLKKPTWYFLEENDDSSLIFDKIESAETLLRQTTFELNELRKYLDTKKSDSMLPPILPN